MNKKNKKITGIVVIFIVVVSVGFWFSQTKNMEPVAPVGWLRYENQQEGFSFFYPPELDLDEQKGSVRLFVHGPTQSLGTEVYDGLIMNFSTGKLSKPLKEFVESEAQSWLIHGEIIQQVQGVKFPVGSGYMFRARGLGEFSLYYLPMNKNVGYLSISILSEDPTNIGFDKVVDGVLDSIWFSDP